MTGNSFSQQLQTWKEELKDEVAVHYKVGNTERGRLAFERWKVRFADFLRKHAPSEAKRFEKEMEFHGAVIFRDEHPYDEFMHLHGNTCVAFVDDLTESVLKGRIGISRKKPSKSRNSLVPSPKVFLSYAHEDAIAARQLSRDLRAAGMDVWFDKESLLPGQKWKTAIVKAIRSSRFFLALLSKVCN